MANKNISISTPEDVLKKIDALAKKRKRSRSFLYTEAAEMLLGNQTDGSHRDEPPTPKKKAGSR